MSKVIAVIGAGYGDEGKGLMTDYFSSKYNSAVVIRYNGGGQAGHTVTTPDGKRHVFSHFSSGTFNGTPTFLSKYFVSNPTLFVKEYNLFTGKFGFKPEIYVDAESLITTPFDMLLNQKIETIRGDNIHGSCGIGFGETIERGLVYNSLTVGDIDKLTITDLFNFLTEIRDEYVPTRIDLNDTSASFKAVLNNDNMIKDWLVACQFMLSCVQIVEPSHFKYNTLIFEGAQGLLLDMDYGYFPHVTRSNCGMKNISNILDTIPGTHDIMVNYVTRAYTTRHGAGPLADERPDMPKYYNIVDKTNIPNQFQGELRFGILDYRLMQSITDKDFLNYASRGAFRTYTVTCLDQLNSEGLECFKDFAMKHIYFNYQSYGPTRKDVKNIGVDI